MVVNFSTKMKMKNWEKTGNVNIMVIVCQTCQNHTKIIKPVHDLLAGKNSGIPSRSIHYSCPETSEIINDRLFSLSFIHLLVICHLPSCGMWYGGTIFLFYWRWRKLDILVSEVIGLTLAISEYIQVIRALNLIW